MEEVVNVAILNIGKTEIGLECIGDQIIVLEDKFKTGYECSKCEGDRYLDEPCNFCNGTGKENADTENESPCRMCCPPDMFLSGVSMPGKRVCPQCGGKGALIVAPQDSQRKPTSGVVKSCGPDVKSDSGPYPLKVGDRVLYSQFAGTGIELKQKGFIRIMHAHEVMCKIYGTGRLGDFVK